MLKAGLTGWHDPDREDWCHAESPRLTITAQTRAELEAFPARVQAELGTDEIAVGLVSYDAGLLLHRIGTSRPAGSPLAIAHLYPARNVQRTTRESLPEGEPWRLKAPFKSDQPRHRYMESLNAVHHYLRAGDCYQVNYARRFSAFCEGDPWRAWKQLTARHLAPHASFFTVSENSAVFGVSPERFLRAREGTLTTEPIKGSRPRGTTPEADTLLAQALQGSAKDRAENLMIVDLLRNDLGQVCETGSVLADPLFELRRFSNVQHLVSTVQGTLRKDVTPLEALFACFPGGSITGAPKKRAMQIIDELEPVSRGFYCGTQFWLDAEGNMDSNILIRTFQQHGNHITCFGGGGIVADSEPDVEFEESEFKVAALLQALDSQEGP